MTLKQSIRTGFMALLNVLEAEKVIRATSRHADLLADNAGVAPAVLYIEGPESHQGSPSEGVDAYRFTVYLKFFGCSEECLALVQGRVESLSLPSGAHYLTGAEERSNLTVGLKFVPGPWLTIDLEYTRKRGNPEAAA
jgi:hypothetical protein